MRGKAAQQKARELLRELNVRMLPDGGEWAQLLDANVPAYTIESLYPFEMSDYAPYVVSWLSAPSRLEQTADPAAICHLVHQALDGCPLSRGELALGLLAENLQVLGQRAFTSANYLSHLLQNLHEYVALLRALRRWPHADLLSSVEPEDFDTLQRCADVLALRLAHRGAEAEFLPA